MFLESIVLFKQFQTDFEQFSATMQGFLASKMYKNYSFEYNGYNVYLTKGRSGTLWLFIENKQI